MAVQISTSIYGVNTNSQGTAQGKTMGFPASGVIIRPVTTNSSFNGVFNGVTVQSVIQLLSHGTVVNEPLYYSSETVAQLITKANA